MERVFRIQAEYFTESEFARLQMILKAWQMSTQGKVRVTKGNNYVTLASEWPRAYIADAIDEIMQHIFMGAL